MITAYRIFKSKHAATWYDGEGAFRYGGRWNSQGTRLLYASSTLSLAALEMLVNLNAEDLLLAYSFARVEFESDIILSVEKFRKLPKQWADSPPSAEIQAIGDEWAVSLRSVVLQVPSAVLPNESNFLISINHSDFPQVRLGKVEAFKFDQRLRRSLRPDFLNP